MGWHRLVLDWIGKHAYSLLDHQFGPTDQAC